jgi:hypothetical protein
LRELPSHPPRQSGAGDWAPLARFIAAEERLGRRFEQRRATALLYALVTLGKLGSWFLLLIISYALVTIINRPRPLLRSDGSKGVIGAAESA